jgi:hypothetical protein
MNRNDKKVFEILSLLVVLFITLSNATRIGRCTFGKLILGDYQQSSIRGVITFTENEVPSYEKPCSYFIQFSNITLAQYKVTGLTEGLHALRIHEVYLTLVES